MLRIADSTILRTWSKCLALSAGSPHLHENGKYPHPSQPASFSFGSDVHGEKGNADNCLAPEEQVSSSVKYQRFTFIKSKLALCQAFICWRLGTENAQLLDRHDMPTQRSVTRL